MKSIRFLSLFLLLVLIADAAYAQSTLSAVSTRLTVREQNVRFGGRSRLFLNWEIRNRLDATPSGTCTHTIKGLVTDVDETEGDLITLRTKRSSQRNTFFRGLTHAVRKLRNESTQAKITIFAEVDCPDDDVSIQSAPVAKNATCRDNGVSASKFQREFKNNVR